MGSRRFFGGGGVGTLTMEGGTATFTQDHGAINTITEDLTVGLYACAWGQYILNNGSLTADREFIKYGRFTQNGGTNTTRKLYAGTMSTTAGHWTWGWGGVGGFWWAWVPRETKYAKYTLNGGTRRDTVKCADTT